jgi:SAM-dependent methyltransferase
MQNKKSLDLGCNNRPCNPFKCEDLYGVDMCDLQIEDVIYRKANLSLEPIPFEDNFFDYVTAFDFIEHIPRVLSSGETTRAPFIEIMNEVYRVLTPNGVFYAITPAYPHAAAFQDPTHNNIITSKTHEYFCGTDSKGKMYGFKGNFQALRTEFVIPKMAYTPEITMGKKLYKLKNRLINPRRFSHFLWELRAVK